MVKTGSNLPRRVLATGLAACAHLLVLFLLGWKIPRFTAPPPDDSPALMLTLMRPQIVLRAAPPKPKPGPSPPAAPARVLTQPAPQAPAIPAPVQPSPAPVPPNLETNPNGDNVRNALRGLIGCTGALAKSLSHAEREACDKKLAAARPPPAAASGPPDCEVEDLPLLTEAERARCRDQIAADQGRRLARGEDARIAKQVARARSAPRIDNIPEDKRAAYDAEVEARTKPPQAPPITLHGSGGAVYVDCKHVTFPLLSGVDINPDLFAKKHKKEKPQHGSVSCSAGVG